MNNVRMRPARRWAARLALVLMLPLAGLAGCDAILGSDSEDGIEGTWVIMEGGFAVYMEITSSTVTFADGEAGDCFYIETYNFTSEGDDRYTVSHPDYPEFAFTITIRRDGDNLVLADDEGSETWDRTDVRIADLEECAVQAGGGDDPSINCATLPAINVGQAITGELATGDAMYSSRYYDLYGLTLASQTAVQIDALTGTSSDLDTYLYLYEGDGTFITENDDGGTGTDARITRTLDAGCYRIEVTSYFTNEMGIYTLGVN